MENRKIKYILKFSLLFVIYVNCTILIKNLLILKLKKTYDYYLHNFKLILLQTVIFFIIGCMVAIKSLCVKNKKISRGEKK
ncbi:hypothetical protein Calkr_0225 [Caldicellulosiruptor acetigenus I77R1B]|uniref:Uncharacterized protein n=1 Tax=Caldicellulosiruptor acetigenus (strain ATCC 700853 / DSM 12137 / I77R1B) TaxID=632335 RepID=E4S715_CALA7|nr:hypothetical protein Calkr_0225 [Caldicellulosiruptor acetigenus I77R1B]